MIHVWQRKRTCPQLQPSILNAYTWHIHSALNCTQLVKLAHELRKFMTTLKATEICSSFFSERAGKAKPRFSSLSSLFFVSAPLLYLGKLSPALLWNLRNWNNLYNDLIKKIVWTWNFNALLANERTIWGHREWLESVFLHATNTNLSASELYCEEEGQEPCAPNHKGWKVGVGVGVEVDDAWNSGSGQVPPLLLLPILQWQQYNGICTQEIIIIIQEGFVDHENPFVFQDIVFTEVK